MKWVMMGESSADAVLFLGACAPVISLVRGPSPGSRTVASSTTIRLACFEGPGGRRVLRFDSGGQMETIFERVGALDVHKAQVTACVRVPDAAGRREPHLAEFQTTVHGLIALRDWLAAHRVTHVAMEATGVYWQPVWHILEDEFALTLCNARHVKNVPGRETDINDAQWLCQLMEAGLLRASFVPPKPQRQLRTLTRYRKTQIAERQREANRLHKTLEDTNIKLDCVATDILGKSGRAMLDGFPPILRSPQHLRRKRRGKDGHRCRRQGLPIRSRSGGRRWSWSVRAARSRTSPSRWGCRRRRCGTGAVRASATAVSATTG